MRRLATRVFATGVLGFSSACVAISCARPPSPVAPVAPTDKPAPGVQLAAGRLGSTLERLVPGEEDLSDLPGEATDGPEVPSVHVLTRNTAKGAYPLHVIAYESLEPVPRELELAKAAAQALSSPDSKDAPVALVGHDSELSIAGVFPGQYGRSYSARPELELELARRYEVLLRWHLLGRLAVAVKEGTFVHILLVCDGSVACRADEPRSAAAALAASLHPGPRLRGGGTWTLRVLDGDADRRITVALPPGVLGLPQRRGEGGMATGWNRPSKNWENARDARPHSASVRSASSCANGETPTCRLRRQRGAPT